MKTNTISKKSDLFSKLFEKYDRLISRKNLPDTDSNGIYTKFKHPIITADHTPLHWRYDLSSHTNPKVMERIGINAAFNAGAIKWNNKYVLCVRVEGKDRKSFFAFAESDTGIDNFKFWDRPMVLPQNRKPDTNVYDMRLTLHEDGYVYGFFCTERKDLNAPDGDTSAAVANAGIIRSKDLITWERLPDLISSSSQQRNVTIHPELVNGRYVVYTRPQDGFIDTGSGGGIGLGYIDDITNPVVKDELILNPKKYHTVYELKNGQGPSPLKTSEGWLHLAHGVRNTAAGLRYVLYMFVTDLNDISKITFQPGGYLMAPSDDEIIGDVGNVLFANGWVMDENEDIFIYYASSDTRTHVAKTSLDTLLDYCKNTPPDGETSAGSVQNILNLIDRNQGYYQRS
ncbi:glycosidase [Flagellimonas sp. CMM7]|uniref:glycoside hydrolase family 130 protein n=1 Tax=Flagellimonas sp. CMM7 TaxID=2654676 RepID=UPI0013D09149|nr:glycosidase [Flagellimonas sp. CMM7]